MKLAQQTGLEIDPKCPDRLKQAGELLGEEHVDGHFGAGLATTGSIPHRRREVEKVVCADRCIPRSNANAAPTNPCLTEAAFVRARNGTGCGNLVENDEEGECTLGADVQHADTR